MPPGGACSVMAPARLAPARGRPRLPSAQVPETTKIRVLHCNSSGDGWTADSPDVAGWQVTGASYEESRALAEDSVRARLGDVEITHHIACSRG
jgi:hypothetical protein